jgi:transketolase
VDLAYTNARVVVCGMSPGVSYGELGPTHHSLEDVAWLRTIDNMVVVVPADPRETGQALWAALEHDGPVFIRVSRMAVPTVYDDDFHFQLGKASRLVEGEDASIIANGTLVARAIEAADILRGMEVSCRVISMPTVKPLDVDEIVRAAVETGAIVTAEEHSIRGGLGGAVAETVVQHHPVPVRIMGFPGFAPTGSAQFLLEHFGLTAGGIADAALELVKRKGSCKR